MDIEQFKRKYNYQEATQVMRQYLDIKFSHFDCLLLFRMGDFYELFYEDAITASRVLGISLTKRGKSGEQEIAMCGVPHHSLLNYLNKLLEEGFKVAICDQLETPEEAKKRGGYKAVVNRSVTRIITPGTITEDSLLNAGMPNYLASISLLKNSAAIAFVDLSTSEINLVEVLQEEIIDELARIGPKELLISEKYRGQGVTQKIAEQLNSIISYQVDSNFANAKCARIILDYYKISDLLSIGHLTENMISALGSILSYITLTQKENAPLLPKPIILNRNKFINIDASTMRSLEITHTLGGTTKGSLFSVVDNTVTKSGCRLLYHNLISPLIDVSEINDRLDLTSFFYQEYELSQAIRELLSSSSDLERCITRINMNRSAPRDLLSIKYTIAVAEHIISLFYERKIETTLNQIQEILTSLSGLGDVYDLIDHSIDENAANDLSSGGVIKLSYDPKLAELDDLIKNGRFKVENLRDHYRVETGVDTLKISSNNLMGMYIEVTPKQANKITDTKFIHRQSTVNSIRYTTVQLQELEQNLNNASQLSIKLEKDIYSKVCDQISSEQYALLGLAKSLSFLDVLTNNAYIAKKFNYIRPVVTDDLMFEIDGGRHPVVEKALAGSNESFTENDCMLSSEERVWLITGPNMSGKSTFLRQNALIAILAQMGSFVPAKKAHIGVVDKIFSRVGAGDDLGRGQSTFMVEMLETASILAQSTYKSLIILDEVGRGTSTYDGVSIAWAVLEHIHDKIRARCLFATHYHELTKMQEFLPALRNYTVDILDDGNNIVFLHKIKKGAADKSYGVHVAEIAGLPKSVINRAKILLIKLEKDSSRSSKNILKSESLNFNLFEPSTNEITKNNQQIIEIISKTDPDQLSPKQALEVIYSIKSLL